MSQLGAWTVSTVRLTTFGVSLLPLTAYPQRPPRNSRVLIKSKREASEDGSNSRTQYAYEILAFRDLLDDLCIALGDGHFLSVKYFTGARVHGIDNLLDPVHHRPFREHIHKGTAHPRGEQLRADDIQLAKESQARERWPVARAIRQMAKRQ